MTETIINEEAIILSAGYSSRAGTYKPLMGLSGKTLLERCMDGMAGVCDRIIVVGGYCIERLIPLVKKYRKAVLIENPDFPKGMFTSVKAGARAAKGERVFIIPGDHPLIEKRIYEMLLKAQGDIIIPTYKGIPGHPVLLSRKMVKALPEEPDTTSLRDFIQKHETITVEVDDEAILTDLDTPEDYEKISKTLKKRGD